MLTEPKTRENGEGERLSDRVILFFDQKVDFYIFVWFSNWISRNCQVVIQVVWASNYSLVWLYVCFLLK